MKPRTRKKPMSEINVVPYIDVMLVLLVIFMITAPLLKQSINVHLPEISGSTLSTLSESPIIITVDHDGHYYLNIANDPKQPLLLDALIPKISSSLSASKQPARDVYIEGDQAVNYGAIVQLIGSLKNAGISKIGLMTQKK